jgi:UDP-glucose 4-epimerase
MKIAVTGGAGLIGSHIADKLIANGHDVFIIDNLIGGSIENVNKKARLYVSDTANLSDMNNIFEREKPEIIYHLACTAYEGLSVFSPYLVGYNTYQNTLGILTASIKHKAKRFIYASSMSRYGKQLTPYTEDMEPRPEDPYAIAKVASEKTLEILAETQFLLIGCYKENRLLFMEMENNKGVLALLMIVCLCLKRCWIVPQGEYTILDQIREMVK